MAEPHARHLSPSVAASAWSAELQFLICGFDSQCWQTSHSSQVSVPIEAKLTSVADMTIWLPWRCLLISR